MKKIFLFANLLFICFNVLAQDAKPCIFIGVYNAQINNGCVTRAVIREEVADYAEFIIKKKQFVLEYKMNNPNPIFVSAKQSVIIYEYEKSGSKCNSKLIGIISGDSPTQCNELLAKAISEKPKEYATKPQITFTRQGKASSEIKDLQANQYIKDYGGLTAKYISGNTSTKDIIGAQFTNKTKDKLATVLLKLDDGELTVDYIEPGGTLTKKYSSKKIEIQVLFQDYKLPKPSVKPIEFMKNIVRETVINENGKVKPVGKVDGGIRG